MYKILAVIDMQNDFVDGVLGTMEAQNIVEKVVQKIESYKKDPDAGIAVTLDTHREDYLDTQEGRRLPLEHCIFKTHGWEMNEKAMLALPGNAKIFTKKFLRYVLCCKLDQNGSEVCTTRRGRSFC